jgi:histidyl-tRNA synthetase
LLPDELRWWRRVEAAARDVFARFGYDEIRTPLFEATELFVRGVGEGTDIVDKEMYTFEDKGNRSITLRPEGTAGVVRACIEHGLLDQIPVRKFCYIGRMYRYERPQAGRYREFWQAGIEVFGVADPIADAEVIVCGYEFIAALDLPGIVVQLNSIGHGERRDYVARLLDYARPLSERFCGKCQHRMERNPLRLFDCKVPTCRELLADAPKTLEHLADESRERLDTVRRLLDRAKVPYEMNPYIVRGLDYYTHTVFEVTAEGLGSQDAVLAGGRYDGLVEELGGKPTPGVGFGSGIDRLVLAMQAAQPDWREPPRVDAYIARIGSVPTEVAFVVATELRRAGLSVDMDYEGRSLRAQLKTADRLGARYTLLLGEDELARESVTIRRMDDGAQETVPLSQVVTALAGRDNRPPTA